MMYRPKSATWLFEQANITAAAHDQPIIPVASLLGAAREALLVHGGVQYRLRITANNKLILTK